MEVINHCFVLLFFIFFIFHQTKTREKLQVLLKLISLFSRDWKGKNQCIFILS